MSVSKLQKQLMRDLKRSPGKAAVLGILCIVAIWFWVPLLFGGAKKPSSPASKPTESAAAPVQGIETPSPITAVTKTVAWHRLVALMDDEPRMQSAQLGSVAAPFGNGEKLADKPVESTTPALAALMEPPPSPAKYKVTSTLLGPRRRVAVINGRPYAEGDELEAGADTPYLIARVTDRSVFVERNGRRWELAIPRKTSTPDP